tara:strand:+ start:15862 stop:18756 length:2895 start_codon:yes stop_codon:yes gene_type:complete
MSNYNHIFDQFQRYSTVTKIISSFHDESKITVLEIGANGHYNLISYLPDADITFSDINDQPITNNIKFIKADASNLPFSDGEFDFVISLDVLEHVPEDKRQKVITECTRVSSKAFILACPIDNDGKTTKSERVANDVFLKFHGMEHPWLKEHFDEGLPTFDYVNGIIEDLSIPFHSFQCGKLEWWESLMKMHYMESADHRFHEAFELLNLHYNQYLHAQDSGGDCYRAFWIIGNDSNSLSCPIVKSTATDNSWMNIMNLYHDAMETVSLENKAFELECKTSENLKIEAESARVEAENARVEAENARVEAEFQLAQLVNSTSMRITMPLRMIARVVRGDLKGIQAILNHRSPLISHLFNPIAGGFSARLRRAIPILMKQGPKSVFNKIRKIKNNKGSISERPLDYQAWLMHHQEQEELDAENVMTLLPTMNQPLISVVIPTYNPEIKILRLCIESVLNQSYKNLELCIADDASTNPDVINVLEEYQRKDKRIKIICRKKNGHISAATNSALELVTGEWVALLDHDDELHKHSLAFVINAINSRDNVEFIYSDEDKIDLQGKRSDPHFKPSWNLDLLYSQNYVSHLGVYRVDIVKKIGGFRIGYEGSQDFDLLLRYSREINHENIVHIPKVLYHWRMVEGSTALASTEKSYTTDVGIKALQDHFNVLGEKVTVQQGKHANIYKVNWQLSDEPLVSLIIPTYNGYEITKQAIDSILEKTTYLNYEIILVDNNSNDLTALAYFEELKLHDKVTVLRYPFPFNYSAINNFAVKEAKGHIIGLINNDIQVITPEWLTEMVSHAQRQDIGCVGAMLYYPNNTIQHAGVICGLGGVAGHSHKYFPREHPGYFYRLKLVQNLSAVTAACLLIKKEIFNEVNGLNEKDLTIAFNDIDFCLKVQSIGYRNLWTPYAELYHHESISRGAEDNPEKIKRFNKEVDYMKNRWKTDIIADFSYNRNLTRVREDFSLSND